MVLRFIVMDENITSTPPYRLNRGQTMLRGHNATKKMLNVYVRGVKC